MKQFPRLTFIFIIMNLLFCQEKVKTEDIFYNYFTSAENLISITEKHILKNDFQEFKKSIKEWYEKNYLIFLYLDELKQRIAKVERLKKIEFLSYMKLKFDTIKELDERFDFLIQFAIHNESKDFKQDVLKFYDTMNFLKESFKIDKFE